MLCRHIFGKISSEFYSILCVFENFADLLEIRSHVTTQNFRSLVFNVYVHLHCASCSIILVKKEINTVEPR